jgi:hypothetical protein
MIQGLCLEPQMGDRRLDVMVPRLSEAGYKKISTYPFIGKGSMGFLTVPIPM